MIRPSCSDQFDYEAELVAFIGKKGRHISRADAAVACRGYSIFNDGSIRDISGRHPSGRSARISDDTGGFGPEFVSAEEVPSGASGLKIQSRLNGQVMQDANTRTWSLALRRRLPDLRMHDVRSGRHPGHGTPGGVGAARKPPVFMKPGDVCEIEIGSVGVLRNPIEQESR